MKTRGFDGKPVWVNTDTPKQRAEVAVGLKNLHHWRGAITGTYTGPWPSAYQLQDDAAYTLFLAREDIAAALRVPGAARRTTGQPAKNAGLSGAEATDPDGQAA